MDVREHVVGVGLGEEPGLADRRELGGVAQDQDLDPEGQEILRHPGAHHRHLVDHEQAGVLQGALRVGLEAGLLGLGVLLVDLGLTGPDFLGKLAETGVVVGLGHLRLHLQQLQLQLLQSLRGLGGRDVDQPVDRGRRAASLLEDERGLAGEGLPS